jgi:hypothetical protein
MTPYDSRQELYCFALKELYGKYTITGAGGERFIGQWRKTGLTNLTRTWKSRIFKSEV